jgi:putative transcriptional regulator
LIVKTIYNFIVMIEPAMGVILLAEPFLQDPHFMRSAILIIRHSESFGTLGFAIHKKLKTPLKEMIIELDEVEMPVYLGGPMEKDTLHYLHQYPQYFDDAVEICEGVYWGGDFEKMKQLIKEGKVAADKIKFILGYSGWDGGQLEEEQLENSWITTLATKEIIFDTPANEIWSTCLTKMGGEYKKMVHYPTNPQLN